MEEKKEYIRKANTLIEARYKLSLTQQRMILLAITQIQPTDENFKKYRIPVLKLIQKADASQNLYHKLKMEAENLLKKPLSIPVEENEKQGWLVCNWFSSVKYINGEGEVEVSFDPNLKPALLLLKEKFTQYMLQYVLPLRSTYAIRIYELLKQYENLEKEKNIEHWRYFEINDFRNLLNLEDKYNRYGLIKRFILDTAKKEINQHTDIYITQINPKRTGHRKVEGITIYWRKKEEMGEKEGRTEEEEKENERKKTEDLQEKWWKKKIEEEIAKMTEEEKEILQLQAENKWKEIAGEINEDFKGTFISVQMRLIMREKLKEQGIQPPKNIEDLEKQII